MPPRSDRKRQDLHDVEQLAWPCCKAKQNDGRGSSNINAKSDRNSENLSKWPRPKQFTDFTGTGVSVWTEKGGLLLHRHTLKWNFFWLLRHLWNWLLGEVHESSIHVNSCCICACGKCFACQECPGSSRGLAQGESPPYW